MSDREPRWLSLAALHAMHDRQLELFGGLRGVRDEGAIESALSRPLNAWAYRTATTVESLAATYLCAVVQQQGYLDGNKRTALAAMLVFLRLNDRTLTAPGPELYAIVMAASRGEVGVEQVAKWIAGYVTSTA